MAGNRKAHTKKTLAHVLKAEVTDERRGPEGPELNSRVSKVVAQTNTDTLLNAEGAEQNPVNSDLDICFCTGHSGVA
ncbi:MAG TPA: hypothetical protein VGO56_10890 [Pyrinomonadaceae bacterium]|jgi:hypothetical protein|nr:hypothetical protein [Pyrinomonadaceae bacterium]